jgi:hypothetical protein
MSVRFDDLAPSDQLDLADAWFDEVEPNLRVDCATEIEEFFEECEEINWGKRKREEIADEVAEVVVQWMRLRGPYVSNVPPALADFVDELGRRGWDLLDPRRARRSKNRDRGLTEVKRVVEPGKLRHPRVKRLKEG